MVREDLESLIAVFRREIVRHYDLTYPDTDGEEDGLVFDDMIQTIKAEVWAEGSRAGWGASNDAGFDSDSYTYDETGLDARNPYKKEA